MALCTIGIMRMARLNCYGLRQSAYGGVAIRTTLGKKKDLPGVIVFIGPGFKVVEFDHFKQEAGLHAFVLSVSDWVDKTNAVGLYVKQGKYGGTYAHKDIAFEFAFAISLVLSYT